MFNTRKKKKIKEKFVGRRDLNLEIFIFKITIEKTVDFIKNSGLHSGLSFTKRLLD